MSKMPGSRQGGSALTTILILVVAGYGVFIGIQYVPQLIESGSVDSILESVDSLQRIEPFTSVGTVEAKINGLLNINEMDNMKDNFNVRQEGNSFIVEVSYERELNLLYEKKKISYEKTLTLK